MRAIRRHARHHARHGARHHARAATVALAAPLAAVVLLLGACSGSDDGGTGPTTEEPTTGATTPGGKESGTPAVDEGDVGTPASEGADCVQGTWVSDPDAQAAQTTAVLGMTDIGAQATITGDSRTTIDGTGMTTEYRDQVVEVSWEMEGQEFRVVNSWSGTLTSTIEVTEDRVVVSDVDSSGLTMTYETFVNGEALDVPGLEDIPMSGFAAGGTSTYTCAGDELRLTPVVEGVDTTALVTVLHREG